MARLTELSLKSRVTVFFLMAAVIFAGLTAYRTLPRESYPDIEIPLIIVYTIYPGAAPADVEKQVTDQLERELKGLEGIKDPLKAQKTLKELGLEKFVHVETQPKVTVTFK